MKKILIFSGTTEGRKLAELLTDAGLFCQVCVATEYGKSVMEKRENLRIHQGRMDVAEMQELMEKEVFCAVVDATHPYAVVVSENIKKSATAAILPYIRLKRETDFIQQSGISYVEDATAAAKLLKTMRGNILLTTGSKDLACYAQEGDLRERLFVRVLPGIESIELCQKQGISGGQIIAMQGPFSTELNEALLRQYQISVLVTKESGKTGGYEEKLEAAQRVGIPVIVIGNPDHTKGGSLEETIAQIEEITGQSIPRGKICISLVGIGMGNPNLLTGEAKDAIRESGVLFGAKRLLASIPMELKRGAREYALYRPKEILPKITSLEELDCETKIAILFSGDTGFYSGAKQMYQALEEYVAERKGAVQLRICPGISSLVYLAARSGKNYQDTVIVSIHGRCDNYLDRIKENPKVFLLVSSVEDMRRLGKSVLDAGLSDVKITVGYQMSYEDEKIISMSPAECIMLKEEGLYACFIENPTAEKRLLTPGLSDADFIRDKVPMTKAEVREVSLCKLKLHPNAVLYDVGSGTGSIAVEAARLSDSIRVYAVEKKEAALSLIEQNAKKHGLRNIEIVSGEAPDALLHLPMPSHAFIGGSGGNLREILSCLYEKNNRMRVVLNAISLETISEVMKLLGEFPVTEQEILQLQVSRAKNVGAYHLMQAENPIYIVSFTFCEEDVV